MKKKKAKKKKRKRTPKVKMTKVEAEAEVEAELRTSATEPMRQAPMAHLAPGSVVSADGDDRSVVVVGGDGCGGGEDEDEDVVIVVEKEGGCWPDSAMAFFRSCVSMSRSKSWSGSLPELCYGRVV
jgi:hypothetical protein